MSNNNASSNENGNKKIPDQSNNSFRRKKRLKTSRIIALIIAFLTLLAYVIAEKEKIFGSHKTSPCNSLKRREDLTMKKIDDLVKSKENCLDKDSIQRYYDFEIKFANAVLQNIKDSLKSCTD